MAVAKKKRASKRPVKAGKAAAKVTNVDRLQKAGVINPEQLEKSELTSINKKLTKSQVNTLITVFKKLGGPRLGRIRFQLCF